jgi:fatty acid/phospholipid biosynthesis enzyme
VKGVCFITHGSSNANAIKNAIRVAAEFAEHPINAEIERTLIGIRASRAARSGIEDVARSVSTTIA